MTYEEQITELKKELRKEPDILRKASIMRKIKELELLNEEIPIKK